MRSRILVVLAALLLLPAAPSHAAPAPRTAESVLAGMTLAQRVGQLLMVGTPADGPSPAATRALARYHVGSVILMGNTSASRRAVASTVRGLRRSAGPSAAGLLVAVDQEGGHVQRLTGPGFAAIPTALTQGRWSVRELRTAARGWAGDLRSAGIDLDLAPVADTVPVGGARTNQPIGRWQREFGHRPARVATHAAAFVRGMADAQVATAAKHFPGLGRVRGNTDDTATVVDSVTRRHDAYLRPFAATVAAGVPFMMMSSASYPRIDRTAPAVFSRTVIHDLLRGDLGFEGVVVSDSLTAAAVARWTPGQRAVRFVAAGGDLALVTTAGPIPAMYAALLKRAQRSPGFRARVDAAALRVLRAKQAQGLL
ncbi:glycoside hydrolase family 3 N-terminal domain-containing protein [Nocardioides sp. CER19]|uniref:glycoside hydrolase family 3 N-terminal domain-containing protein n=1 Tax=Nocardioides sp. CER19 TaxID=3038538 RepID=UPI0024499C40|nr:glycoside hydrolase family 3 N-terminal domain-containing protein [Nocardioides sp. CER19]MDH2413980.1 glycoside hydrolase family 3 N-terminal domain-containing protein [Nocardioides sp. CER19]